MSIYDKLDNLHILMRKWMAYDKQMREIIGGATMADMNACNALLRGEDDVFDRYDCCYVMAESLYHYELTRRMVQQQVDYECGIFFDGK